MELTPVTIKATVSAPIEKVWSAWTTPAHIVQWNTASPDWHTPRAENDLRPGGRFLSRMEARDGSFGFDFSGEYTDVQDNSTIAYRLDDGRMVHTVFQPDGNTTHIVSTFDPEGQNPVEMQQAGWQAILDNFKQYAEAL